MPQNEEDIIDGTIPVVVNFDHVVMGKVSSRKLEGGDVELVIFLYKKHADEIIALIKGENYTPVALSFAYISSNPNQRSIKDA